MKLTVPINKDASFSTTFFNTLSECINILGSETGKWPDRILFSGQIGGELVQLIESTGWDLGRFEISHSVSNLNQMTVDYSKPLDQIEDIDQSGKSKQSYYNESIHGKVIKGIPSQSTLNHIIGSTAISTFKLERKIRPRVDVKLIR